MQETSVDTRFGSNTVMCGVAEPSPYPFPFYLNLVPQRSLNVTSARIGAHSAYYTTLH